MDDIAGFGVFLLTEILLVFLVLSLPDINFFINLNEPAVNLFRMFLGGLAIVLAGKFAQEVT